MVSILDDDPDIFRLEITMDDSGIMSRRQPMGNVGTHIDGFAKAHRAACSRSQSFSLQRFGNNIWRTFILAEAKDRHNVGMIQGGCGLGF